MDVQWKIKLEALLSDFPGSPADVGESFRHTVYEALTANAMFNGLEEGSLDEGADYQITNQEVDPLANGNVQVVYEAVRPMPGWS